jgi:hypothetical protein
MYPWAISRKTYVCFLNLGDRVHCSTTYLRYQRLLGRRRSPPTERVMLCELLLVVAKIELSNENAAMI